jgi:ADP-ribosylglycohydrolase
VLVFNPAVADTLKITTNIQSRINTTIIQNIASTLYKRGLEKQTANERAEEMVGDDTEVFAMMLDNLLNECSDITKGEILDYLATAALHKQEVELSSYDHLVYIYSKIKQSVPNEKARNRLSMIAKRNMAMIG